MAENGSSDHDTELYDFESDSELERSNIIKSSEKGKKRSIHNDLWKENIRKRRRNQVRIIAVSHDSVMLFFL